MSSTEQLPLSVMLDDRCDFANFYSHNNDELLEVMQQFLTDSTETVMFIWGDRGVGKTHLLQASCYAAQEASRKTAYMDCVQLMWAPEQFIDVVQSVSLLCVDHVEAVLQDQAWQEALFFAFNHLKQSQKQLILASGSNPRHLAMSLEDLRSRFSWGVIYQVQSLNDDDKIAVLQMRAKRRGLSLNKDVAQYLLVHLPRNMKDLIAVLEKLDVASLAAQRSLTIPFVKQVLGC